MTNFLDKIVHSLTIIHLDLEGYPQLLSKDKVRKVKVKMVNS
jgi:hypothetical protein